MMCEHKIMRRAYRAVIASSVLLCACSSRATSNGTSDGGVSGMGGEAGSRSTGGATAGTKSSGGAGDGGSSGEPTSGTGGSAGDPNTSGAGGESGSAGDPLTAGAGAGGVTNNAIELDGSFVSFSVDATAEDVHLTGALRWHAMLEGERDGIVLRGAFR